MDNRAIGVFDSGLGGLTAVRELRAVLPNESIVYFGDTGRLPYGTKGRETIIKYAKQDMAFLLEKNVKYILAACGTVSSAMPKEEADKLIVPYLGVVQAAAQKAAQVTKNKRIGILGTAATVASGSYADAIHKILPDAQITATSCPLFVPLVENGYFHKGDMVATLVAQDYLKGCLAAGVDTIILGCTHYPLLTEIFEQLTLGITLVNPSKEAVHFLKAQLKEKSLLTGSNTKGEVNYYVSDSPSSFYALAKDFLGELAEGSCQQITVDNYEV